MKIKYFYFIIMLIGFFLIITSSFLIPKSLLLKRFSLQLNTIKTAPSQYYQASGTALARNASRMLNPMDRVALITGTIKSTCKPATYDNVTLSEIEVVEKAIDQIEFYFMKNTYPVSLKSGYQNWYSYTTEVYSYTDQSFETYSAYLFYITFLKYDNSVSHTILMTEDGTILYARMSEEAGTTDDISHIFEIDCSSPVFCDDTVTIQSITATFGVDLNRRITGTYQQIDADAISSQNCYFISLISDSNDPITYYVFQYNGTNSYAIGIVPDTSLIYKLSAHTSDSESKKY